MNQRDYQNLTILKELEVRPATTMRMAAAKLDVSVKLVHSLIKGLMQRGLIHVKERDGRSFSYLVTPAGVHEKARLTYEFIEFSTEFFREARKRSSHTCKRLVGEGVTRVAFLGCGELAEITYLGILQYALSLVAVYDDTHAGGCFLNHAVQPVAKLRRNLMTGLEFERVIITAYDPDNPAQTRYHPDNIKLDDRFCWAFE